MDKVAFFFICQLRYREIYYALRTFQAKHFLIFGLLPLFSYSRQFLIHNLEAAFYRENSGNE